MTVNILNCKYLYNMNFYARTKLVRSIEKKQNR